MPQTNQAPISMDTDKPVETPSQVENVTEPRRSGRMTRTPARYLNLHENVQDLFVHGNNDHRDDPYTYEEAISDVDSFKWLEAMKSEIDSMSENQDWDLVDPHKGIVPMGNKWVFKRKICANGKVETYKARLVAKGYLQRQGVDYEETFSPITMLKSIKIMLVIVAHYDYKASRSWNRRFDEAVKSFGFIKNEDEPCVYKKASESMIAFLVLYVDDILLIAIDAVWIRKFVTKLGFVPSISSPVELYCDNTEAIAQAKEPRSHQKSKHIEMRYHIIREIIGRGNVAVQKVPSTDNVADPLTKAMT
ncbi:hypothetical protein CRG98_016026 [Punica granatum]|uniref:Reverse transcriptase Ty1/copia-type domain-containing protein n=1 Tax=Punica granatum TaxID=22663 RepID=A0A2I0K4W4_PUNGR|nr:hypothetical protein CRG98_016026 [Punica granatum]